MHVPEAWTINSIGPDDHGVGGHRLQARCRLWAAAQAGMWTGNRRIGGRAEEMETPCSVRSLGLRWFSD